jgi:predicted deacylase
MDLESRMAAVERELSSVREQELPSLRSELERKYHDLRVETHGWAEVAIKAGKKVDATSEIVNLTHNDVGEIKEEVREVRTEQVAQREVLAGIQRELSQQGDTLQKILAKLS